VSKNATASFKVSETKAEVFDAALAALKSGGVIAFPTETLYGLGADALDTAAVEKVFQLKGRDSAHPIPVLVADRAMLDSLVAEVTPLAERLIAEFWPGPLTLVLPARSDLPKPLLNPTGNIGVRISSQSIAGELVKALGRPITATSANPSGQSAARTVEQARNYFSRKIEVFVDGGELTSQTGSTVAEIRGDRLRIIREGDVSREKLQRVVGKNEVMR
jgi:L-threonylcarbamoyladenylate synthase